MYRRAAKITAWILGVLLLLGLLGYLMFFVIPSRKIAAIETRLREEGRPTILIDFASTPVPEEQNAAPLILEAYALLETVEKDGESIFYHQKSAWNDPEHEKIFTELSEDPKVDVAVTLLLTASEKPFCQFSADYSKGTGILLPHLPPLLALGNFSKGLSVRNAEAGKKVEAMKYMEITGFLAASIREEPILISRLVHNALSLLLIDSLQQFMTNTALSSDSLLHVEALLKNLPVPELWKWMESERIYYLEAWRNDEFREGVDFSDLLSDFDAEEILHSGLSALTPRLDELYFLETTLRLQEEFQQPFTRIDWDRYQFERDELPTYFYLSQSGLETFIRSRIKETELLAQVQLAKLGVTIHQYKLKHGTFPESLGGFVPEETRDPFTGEPFRYQKTETGFRLYSVGPNLKDENGGLDRSRDIDDLLWSYPYEDRRH